MRIQPRFSKRFLLLVSVVTLLPSFAAAVVPSERSFSGPRKLHHRIEAILRQSEGRRGFWGIEVMRLPEGAQRPKGPERTKEPEGKVLYSLNADHLFLPASNMKLLTTAAAIEKLGADFIYRTTVESAAAPDAQGRVGDLFLVGRGDPNLSSRVLPYQANNRADGPADAAFQKLADQLVAEGLREVTGDLIADDTWFLFEPFNPGWAEEDIQWGYGAPVTALAFNDNALTLHAQPGSAVGAPARVWLEPVGDYYRLVSHLQTAAGETRIHFERASGSTEFNVWGQISAGAGGEEDRVAIADPPRLAGELFRRALESRGIAVRGRVEVRRVTPFETAASSGCETKTVPPVPRVVLAEHDSPSLGESIKVINKVSQNLHAEMLLRTLGRETKNCGSWTQGLEALQEFAGRIGIEAGQLHLTDGSGLSRKTLVAPAAVVKLLAHMSSSPQFGPFFDSLPVAGLDGTLAGRFKDTPAQGRIHAKTGTVEHVNALSGYMDLPSGRRLAFSIIANSHPLSSDDGASNLDRIALAIYSWFASRK